MSYTPPPTPPPPGPQPPGYSGSRPPADRGIVARIFDLSFREFVTPSIIKVIFVLGVIVASVSALVAFIALASRGGGGVILGLIVAPLVFVLYVLLARVSAELYLVLFRIEANTRKH